MSPEQVRGRPVRGREADPDAGGGSGFEEPAVVPVCAARPRPVRAGRVRRERGDEQRDDDRTPRAKRPCRDLHFSTSSRDFTRTAAPRARLAGAPPGILTQNVRCLEERREAAGRSRLIGAPEEPSYEPDGRRSDARKSLARRRRGYAAA